MIELRGAQPNDAPTIAEIWEQGWRDGHLGNVPADLVAVRTPATFRTRAAARVDDTTSASSTGRSRGS